MATLFRFYALFDCVLVLFMVNCFCCLFLSLLIFYNFTTSQRHGRVFCVFDLFNDLAKCIKSHGHGVLKTIAIMFFCVWGLVLYMHMKGFVFNGNISWVLPQWQQNLCPCLLS